jgi:YD repeat-containing protein
MLVYAPNEAYNASSGATPTIYQYDQDGNTIAVTSPLSPDVSAPPLISGADTTGGSDPIVDQADVQAPDTDYYEYNDLNEQVASWTAKATGTDTFLPSADDPGIWIVNQSTYDPNGNVTQTSVGGEAIGGSGASVSGSTPPVVTDDWYTPMDQQASQTITGVPSTEASTSGGTTQTTTSCYDLNGFETDQVLPAGQSTATTCPNGISLANNLPSGTTHAVHNVLDADGDQLVTEQEYANQNGQSVQGAQLTSYDYNALGEQIAESDPSDNLGSATAGAEANAASALSGTAGLWRTRTIYDAAGDAIDTIVNPGLSNGTLYQTINQFDAVGNLLASENAADVLAQGGPPAMTQATGQYALVSNDIAENDGTNNNSSVTELVPNLPNVPNGTYDGLTINTYDGRNLLMSQTNPVGDETLYGRQADGKICWIMSPNGVAYETRSGGAGLPWQISQNGSTTCSNSDPWTTNYSYTPQGWISSIQLPVAEGEYSYPTTPFGVMSVQYSYDLVGDPTSITDPNGRRMTNTFYDTGDLASTTMPWWWTYSPSGGGSGPDPNDGSMGQLSPMTPSGGQVQQKSLQQIFQDDYSNSGSGPSLPSDGISGNLGDVAAQPLPGILPNGYTTDFGYTGQGWLNGVAGAQAIADGATALAPGTLYSTMMTFDPDGHMLTLTQPPGGETDQSITTYTYDPDGNMLSDTSPLMAVGSTPLVQGNAVDAAISLTNETTNYTYDGLDRLYTVTAPGAGTSAASTASQAPTTDVTQYCYYLDPTGGSDTASPSDTTGCPTDNGSASAPLSVNELNGVAPSVAQRVLSIDPSDHASTVDYDSLGNELDSTDPLGNETSYGYDALGDQTTITEPNGNTTSTPSLANSTSSDYDVAGQLLYSENYTESGASGLIGNTTSYLYDANGNTMQVSAPGASNSSGNAAVPQVTDYTYNGRGLLWSTTTGAGSLSGGDGQNNARTTVTETDGDGNIVRVVNPSGTNNPSGTLNPWGMSGSGLAYDGYAQDFTNTNGGSTVSGVSGQTTSDQWSNIDATINVYDTNNQLTETYLPWGCDLTANTAKSACTTAEANNGSENANGEPDPRRWRIDYGRTSPSDSNGDWVASVTQPYEFSPTTATPATTELGYAPNGWITTQIDPEYQDGDQQFFTYEYDPAGDQVSEEESGVFEGQGGSGSSAPIRRLISRSYWPDGQPQQVDGCAANSAGQCTQYTKSYGYYWQPTGQLSEVGGLPTSQASQQGALPTDTDQICYDADGRQQLVDETIPANTTLGEPTQYFDTAYAYDADGNTVGREANGQWGNGAASCPTFLPQGQLPVMASEPNQADAYNGGQTTTFAYNNLDEQTQMTVYSDIDDSPQQPTRSYATTYWASGQPHSQTRTQGIGWPFFSPTNEIDEDWYYNDNGQESEDAIRNYNDGSGNSTSTKNTSYTYDTDGNLTQNENGSHVYNPLDQEVQWTRGTWGNTANPGDDVQYMYDGAGALMQESAFTAGSATVNGQTVQGQQDTTTLFCSQSASAPSGSESAFVAFGTPTSPTCQLDDGRADQVFTLDNFSATTGGVNSTTETNSNQDSCYDDFGELVEQVESPSTCTSSNPDPTKTSRYSYNPYGQETTSSVPFGSMPYSQYGPCTVSNGCPQYMTTSTMIYDALGRLVEDGSITYIPTAESAEIGGSIFGYLGLSSAVSYGQGTTANGTPYTNTYDYDSNGSPLGVYTSSTSGYYSYSKGPTGSVLGLENGSGTVSPDDAYHYTPDGELELGSNQIGSSLPDQLGDETPDLALSLQAQANTINFDGYQYNGGTSPAGSPAGTPGTDSYTLPARSYVPGNDAYTTPDTFEDSGAEAGLASDPDTTDLYAFDAGNPTTYLDSEGHRLAEGDGGEVYNPPATTAGGESATIQRSGTVVYYGGRPTKVTIIKPGGGRQTITGSGVKNAVHEVDTLAEVSSIADEILAGDFQNGQPPVYGFPSNENDAQLALQDAENENQQYHLDASRGLVGYEEDTESRWPNINGPTGSLGSFFLETAEGLSMVAGFGDGEDAALFADKLLGEGAPAAEDGIGVDRGDGRDVLGRFTGVGGYGADAEAQGLEQYAADTGREVISDQVRATLPDGSIRYYDGLSPNGDGTYEGIEVKSGSAGLTEGQQAFDGAVNDGTSATATLNGQPIQITSTRNVVVP